MRPAERLRVAILCQNDFAAPTEKQALGFAEQLLARGHAVLILIGRDASTIQSEGADRVDGLELRHYRFRGPRLRAEDVRVVREFEPGLIHAFNPRAPTVAAASQLRKATAAPVFVHFEDDEWRPPPQAFPGERFYLPAARWVRRHLWPLHPPLWWQATPLTLRWAARNALAFDALTPVLAEEVRRRLGRDCSVVLPITPETIAGDAAGGRPTLPDVQGRIVAYTGTVLPVYLPDLRLGLEAVAEVQRRGHDVTFMHAGHTFGFDPQRLARDAGLRPGSAHFLGYRPFRAMWPLLERADVLIQPGPPSEFNRLRLPSKMQTYLASGTPTVTFAVGFGELLEDGRDVLKTYTAEPAELADQIAALLGDPALAERIGAGGRAAAARLFDPAANTDALIEHYRRSLAA